MNWIKNNFLLVIVNILVLIFLIILIETSFLFIRTILDKSYLGWIIPSIKNNQHNNPCEKMITHPILSHIHYHENKCNIIGGFARGQFVYYDNNTNNKNIILTLGGSTTDGWFGKYSKGNTWPKIFNQLCNINKEKNCSVINGAVGGYNSSQELLKLLIRGSILDENIKYVISLNGVNEIEGYSGTNLFYNTHTPFLTGAQIYMSKKQKWYNQSKNLLPIFPNIN